MLFTLRCNGLTMWMTRNGAYARGYAYEYAKQERCDCRVYNHATGTVVYVAEYQTEAT